MEGFGIVSLQRFAMVLLLSLICLAMPIQAPALTTKRSYEKLVASWPAEGEAPSEEYAKKVVLNYMGRVLKDPYSTRYTWGTIEQGTFKGFGERFGVSGWIFTVQINSKNSYGAYAGNTPFKFVFRSNWLMEAYTYENRYGGNWVATIGLKPLPPLSIQELEKISIPED